MELSDDVKATRFYARFAQPNFDLVSSAIKRDYELRGTRIMINHSPFWLFNFANRERVRARARVSVCALLKKPSPSKMTKYRTIYSETKSLTNVRGDVYE